MKTYQYKARDKKGKLNEGVIRADSPQNAAQRFKEMGMVLLVLKEQSTRFSFADKLFFLKGGVSIKDVMLFTRQMYALCIAGLPLVKGIKSLSNSTKNKTMRGMLEDIRRDIESGSSFSATLTKYPKAFNKIYCSTIKAGEASGSLPEVLSRLAESIEKDQEVTAKIKQAMSYPVIVIAVIIIAILAIGLFVLPRFMTLFEGFNVEIPIFTKILMRSSYFLQHYWYYVIIGIVVFICTFRFITRTPVGKLLWHRFLLKVYIFGPLFTKIFMCRFARTIGTLVKSGVPIVETLNLAGQTADNVVLTRAMNNVKEKVREGKSIAASMSEETVFPDMIIQMVASGEEAGRIDELMEMVADYYERESDYTIHNLTLLLEPLLLLFIAGIVVVLALGVFLPLWSMSGSQTAH
ncbi:MAG: type II secretion system F family protein [Candidatus Omnitrophica bacterium]|nr:type II secretion system F family protein [Candidatus Omnitrophota bacterium]